MEIKHSSFFTILILSALQGSPNNGSEAAVGLFQHRLCADRGVYNNYILIENEEKTWCQAQLYCRRYFTDLVSISNETQNTQVIEEGKNKTFWIGLLHDEWEWVDNSCSTFRDWDSDGSFPSLNCSALSHSGSSMKGAECNDEDKSTFCSKGKQ
uniref:C-type lectin domain-containing protein n=1 Tax=Seriola lalandi dorsalis TaxID=1841481 RepID=A0A3B4XFV5_SERLL